MGRPRHSDARIAELRTLWGEGHSARQIGARVSMSRCAVLGVAHREDFPPRASLTERRDRIAAVRADWMANVRFELIGRLHGLTDRQVTDMAYHHNFPKRRR